LEGVIAVKLQIRRCVNRACAFYHRPYRPELEGRLALPHHEFGLDVIAWVGARRYQDHRTVAEIHQALTGQGVRIALRTVDALLQRYEEWVSVTLASPERRTRLRQQGRLILAIDGLQPDKGHKVLWVVREVLSGDVLLARSLLASGRDDLSALLRSAVADLDDLPVVGVVSDGQMALRQAVAQVFPHMPHQLCQFHYLREAGRPIWEAISLLGFLVRPSGFSSSCALAAHSVEPPEGLPELSNFYCLPGRARGLPNVIRNPTWLGIVGTA